MTLDGTRSKAGKQASFLWEQIDGPALDIQGRETPVARVVTKPFEHFRRLSDIPGVVNISPADAGLYTFRLTIRQGKYVDMSEVRVRSAPFQPGTGGAALHADVYLNGGKDEGGGYLWELKRPTGSQAVLVGATTRMPHFRPDVKGAFLVTETKGGYSFDLWTGRYDVIPTDCGRPDCHPREEERWKSTRHFAVGKDERRHRPDCVRCHTVGHDPGIDNGGFDEACPDAKCPDAMWPLESVSCLACHGPGFRSKANYAEGMCAQCHDAPPRYTKVQEWRRARMSQLTAGLDPAKQAVTPGCPDCHSSQGFVRWLAGKPGKALGLTFAAPVACPTCHDPHGSTNPRQLRLFGDVALRSGLQLKAVGAGALCAACHNAGQTEAAAAATAAAPHAPQADLIFGSTEHPMDCTVCHVAGKADPLGGGHTFRVISETGAPRVAACSRCHGDLKDFDWRGVRPRLKDAMARARAALDRTVRERRLAGGKAVGVGLKDARIVLVDAAGAAVGTPDAALFHRAWAYFVVERDRSIGLHAPKRALALLATAAGQ